MLKRCFDLGIAAVAYVITENICTSLAAVALGEYGLYKIKENENGKKTFDELGVKLDNFVIDELIFEFEKVNLKNSL